MNVETTTKNRLQAELHRDCKVITAIANISKENALKDFKKIMGLTAEEFYKIKPLSRIGNNCVDYFTFAERLETVGSKNVSFWDVWDNKNEYMNLPYIETIIEYYRKNRPKVNDEKMWYRIYNLCFGSITIFRPLVAMNVYYKYKPECVLDYTMGWSGRLVAACACNVPKYIGIDSNMNLKKPYNDMIEMLREPVLRTSPITSGIVIQPLSKTEVTLHFQDALTIDYSKMNYDMVLTSPPYYNLEIYRGTKKQSKNDWNKLFYIPIINMTWKHLKMGGFYCLNVNKEIYNNVCVKLLGEANECIPLIKRERNVNNNPKQPYHEFIYVWFKTTRNENMSNTMS